MKKWRLYLMNNIRIEKDKILNKYIVWEVHRNYQVQLFISDRKYKLAFTMWEIFWLL